MSAKLSTLVSEFETEEQEASYDEVMAAMDALISQIETARQS